jgi:hypothetical protein
VILDPVLSDVTGESAWAPRVRLPHHLPPPLSLFSLCHISLSHSSLLSLAPGRARPLGGAGEVGGGGDRGRDENGGGRGGERVKGGGETSSAARRRRRRRRWGGSEGKARARQTSGRGRNSRRWSAYRSGRELLNGPGRIRGIILWRLGPLWPIF